MPTPPKGFQEEPPALTAREIAMAKGEFRAEAGRQAKIAGDDSQAVIRALIAIDDELVVTSRFVGPEVRYHTKDGTFNAAETARVVADRTNARTALLAFGEDPVDTLSKRLQALGVDADTANAYAPRHIIRVADGRVGLVDQRTGEPMRLANEMAPDALQTDAQRAAYSDGKAHLADATRLALAHIEADKKRAPTPAVDKRAFVRSAF